MPPFLTSMAAKLIGAGLIVLLIAGLWIRGNHFESQRDKERVAHAETVRRVKVAQDEALAAAIAARNAAESRYAALAERSQANAQATRERAQNASDRFLAAAPRCVRAEAAQSSRGRAVAAAPDRGAGVPAGVPSGGELVAVEPADVRACGAATAYALAAREWALSLTD